MVARAVRPLPPPRTRGAQPGPSPGGPRLVAVAVGAVIAVAVGALYVATAARDIVFGDSPELTAVALTLGVAHPRDYPTYTLIGWPFGQLPVGPGGIPLRGVPCRHGRGDLRDDPPFHAQRPGGPKAAAALATGPLFWA